MALNFANNNSLSAITTQPSGLSGGALNLISTQTASSSSTISFTSGIDSTYDEYVFKFYNIHPGSHDTDFTFQGSIDSGSNYNLTMTTTVVSPYHYENDGGAALYYNAPKDQAQGTAFQSISDQVGNEADQSVSGSLRLFNPSSTTFVKHYICNVQTSCLDSSDDPYSMNDLSAGYFNNTNNIDAIQFKMSSGNIDSGVIKLYGIS